MVNDKLDEIFDIEPISSKKELVVQEAEIISEEKELMTSEEKMNEDIDNVREVQYHLIEVGKEAIDNLSLVAQQSEASRAYEVLANLIKTTSEVAKSLADTSIEKHKVTTKVKEKEAAGVTNNILFTGSTADLQKFLKEQQKELTSGD